MSAAPAAPEAAAAPAPAAAAGTMLVGGRAATLLSDAHFGALRSALGYDAWLPEALAAFDWGRMAAGGGKGGDKMARTPCKRLFVKEVSKGDHATLQNEGFLKARAARDGSRRLRGAGQRRGPARTTAGSALALRRALRRCRRTLRAYRPASR